MAGENIAVKSAKLLITCFLVPKNIPWVVIHRGIKTNVFNYGATGKLSCGERKDALASLAPSSHVAPVVLGAAPFR